MDMETLVKMLMDQKEEAAERDRQAVERDHKMREDAEERQRQAEERDRRMRQTRSRRTSPPDGSPP